MKQGTHFNRFGAKIYTVEVYKFNIRLPPQKGRHLHRGESGKRQAGKVGENSPMTSTTAKRNI